MKRIMKKTAVLTLGLGLLCAVPAAAQEGEYLRTVPQYSYINATLIPPELYPEMCLTTESPSSIFSGYAETGSLFLCLPGPEGAMAESFRYDEAAYLDDQNKIQYSYVVRGSDSFEEFINKAEKDEYILLDGMDGSGTAAYIDPEGCRAYGMVATKEFGKSSKLVISIGLDSLSTKMPLETRVESLTQAILPEVERITQQMHFEDLAPYWSDGRYAGVKMLDYDFIYLAKVDFPTFTCYDEQGNSMDASLLVTEMDGTSLEGSYVFSNGCTAEAEIEFDDYAYPSSMLEDQDENASVQTLENGNEWIIYLAGINSENQIYNWHAARDLGIGNDYGNYYLTVHMVSTDGIVWADMNDVLTDLAKFDAAIEVLDPASDPYVPSETASVSAGDPQTEETAPAQDAAADEWTCPSCQTVNTGKFCTECGTQKPAEEWTCPSCGETNSGKFCSNCGTARP